MLRARDRLGRIPPKGGLRVSYDTMQLNVLFLRAIQTRDNRTLMGAGVLAETGWRR